MTDTSGFDFPSMAGVDGFVVQALVVVTPSAPFDGRALWVSEDRARVRVWAEGAWRRVAPHGFANTARGDAEAARIAAAPNSDVTFTPRLRPGKVTVSATAPAAPANGDYWIGPA